MNITEKHRLKISLALPTLGLAEAKKIADECHCRYPTVYREWRKIKGTTPGHCRADNPVVVMLAELAARRSEEAKQLDKRMKKTMTQLSVA